MGVVSSANRVFVGKVYAYAKKLRFNSDEAFTANCLTNHGIRFERMVPTFIRNDDGLCVQAFITPIVIRDNMMHKVALSTYRPPRVFMPDGIIVDHRMARNAWRKVHMSYDVIPEGSSVFEIRAMLNRRRRPKFVSEIEF